MKKFIKYLPIFVTILLMFPMVVNALCFNINKSGYGEYGTKLLNLIDKIAQLVGAVGIGIALIIIIVGGISYMTAGDDETKVGKARKFITAGLIGVAIVLAADFLICFVAEILENSIGGNV